MDSGIAIREKSVGPLSLLSRAALLSLIVDLRQERGDAIAALGPRPQRWRPFARNRWDRRRKEIGEHYLALAKEIAAEHAPQISDLALEHVWL